MKPNKNILVLTDFSENANAAEEYTIKLARQLQADVIFYNAYPVHVIPIADTVLWPHDDPPSLELQSISNLQSRVNEWKEMVEKFPGDSYKPVISDLSEAGSLENNLLDVIIKNDIWFVVMGTKGEGRANNAFLGSSVFNVLENVDCPVLIVPQNADFRNLKKIGYATDLLTTDVDIVEWIRDFSKNLKLKLFVVHVSPDDVSPERQENQKLHEKILQKLTGIEIQSLFGQNVKRSLHKITEDMDVDLLAVMHRKYGFFESLFHASISHEIIRHTKIPILIFPG